VRIIRKQWFGFLAIVLLLFLGWAAFRLLNPGLARVESPGFREWFWEIRSLDLLVQMALIFAGALGIAAILPVEDGDE
jgi:hypothetical protein